jgi:hypothetical protein
MVCSPVLMDKNTQPGRGKATPDNDRSRGPETTQLTIGCMDGPTLLESMRPTSEPRYSIIVLAV